MCLIGITHSCGRISMKFYGYGADILVPVLTAVFQVDLG